MAETSVHPDRRTGVRLDLLGDLRGTVMVLQPMAVHDISPDGAQVETTFPLPLDSLHEVRLALGDTSVIVKGRVVHCSVSDMDRETVAYRCGLEFVEVAPAARELIARYMDAVRAERLAALADVRQPT